MNAKIAEKQKIYISGVGSAHPQKCVTNDELSKIIDTSDEWIVQRTGIKQRYIIANNNPSAFLLEENTSPITEDNITLKTEDSYLKDNEHRSYKSTKSSILYNNIRTLDLINTKLGHHEERYLKNSENSHIYFDENNVTGIKKENLEQKEENIVTLCAEALLQALDMSSISPDQLDAIIVATTTPHKKMPSTASLVQSEIGISDGCMCFDLQAACAGFVTGLQVAYGLIFSGQCQKVGVIGADIMSQLVDWQDRSTCVLFADGAGAVIVENRIKALHEKKGNSDRDLLDELQSSDKIISLPKDYLGENNNPAVNPIEHLLHGYDPLETQGDILDMINYTLPELNSILMADHDGTIKMDGKSVYKCAVQELTKLCELLIKRNGITINDISWFIPHQANIRILEAIADGLEVKKEKFVVTVDRYANTSAASIPMALNFLHHNGEKFYKKLQRGDLIIMLGVGAGMVLNAVLIRW